MKNTRCETVRPMVRGRFYSIRKGRAHEGGV
jgi:hypothetical protein